MDLARIRADRKAIESMRERWFVAWENSVEDDKKSLEDVLKVLYMLHYSLECAERGNRAHS